MRCLPSGDVPEFDLGIHGADLLGKNASQGGHIDEFREILVMVILLKPIHFTNIMFNCC